MDSHTNGSMNTNSTPTEPTPEVAPGWTYERRLALFILGKLAVEGFLNDIVFDDGIDYVINSTAENISEGIEALCCDGDLEAVSHQADIGRLHIDRGEQS